MDDAVTMLRRQAGWLPAGALVAAVLSGFAAAGGGYFPPAWSWASIGFALVAAAALVLRCDRLRLGRGEQVLVGGLTAFSAWTWLSLLWTGDTGQTVLEGQRTLLYALGALALAAVARRSALWPVAGAVLAVTAGTCCAALAVRLFPERFGVYDPISENRLAEPLGYWNGLGLVAAVGIVLAIGVVAHARHPLARALAGAATVPAALTAYFTFSRGAWVALAIGVVVALALPGRLRILVAGLAVAVPCALVVGIASRQEALKTRDAELAQASFQGHRVALLAVLVLLAAAVLGWAAAWLAGPLEQSRAAVRGANAGLAVGAVAAVIAVLVAGGGPVRLVERAADSFTAAPTSPGDDVSKRLTSFNGSYRAEMWDVAGGAVSREPLLGIGAGAYGREWLAERPVGYFVKEAHNLYLETLAELGPLGLLLLGAALGAPLAAVRRARREPLVAVALGGYVAFLAHAAIDWDWELPSVTVGAVLLGGALLATGRGERVARVSARRTPRLAAAGSLVLLTGLLAFFLGGNIARDEADAALHVGDAATALAAAQDAEGWQPWTADPLRLQAEAQLVQGRYSAARTAARQATADDPGSARGWTLLATATQGSERASALARAAALDPLGDRRGLEEEPAP